MEIYKFKCENCGSTTCDKIDENTYKCVFCGKEERIFIEKDGKKSNESYLNNNINTDNLKSNYTKDDGPNDNLLKTNKNNTAEFFKKNHYFITLLVCVFFGYLGIHKILQQKPLIGVIYLFTGGLVCFGWIIDIFKCFVDFVNRDKLQ